MDLWSLAAWVVLDLLSAVAHEVTVRSSDLKPCNEDRKVCVVNPRDCDPRPSSAIEKSLNLSCYYQMARSAVTCEWSEASASVGLLNVSLTFRSKNIIYSCKAVLNPAATLSVTAKLSSVMGPEVWSQPLTVRLYRAVKPSRPVLTVLGSSASSIDVTWRSTADGGCRLRYRATGTRAWTQAADAVPAQEDQTLTHSIKGLLPFTAYGAAAACRGDAHIWSDWSAELTARTADAIPSRPVDVCYAVEKAVPGRSFLLRLRWQDGTPCRPGSRVLGYQVSYRPERKKQLQEAFTLNVTEATALLPAEEGNCSVSVRAYNAAGYGPAAQLHVDVRRATALPPVRNLWVSSSFPARNAVQVQWQPPSGPPASHFQVQWRPETRPSIGCWITVGGWNSSALIEDMGPDGSYLISVIPIYQQRCGASWSLPASLQHGALMEAVRMKVTGVTETTVTVNWVWQRRSRPVRVSRYRVMLRRGSEVQTTSLWPDRRQHVFHHLKPNSEYSLLLLADNVSRHATSVKTDFDQVAVAAAATPPLLLAAVVFITFLLSRTTCKSRLVPVNARSSKTGDWLMNPTSQGTLGKKFLDIEDFRVLDVLGDTGPLLVGPRPERLSKADPREDAPAVRPDSVRLSDLVAEPGNGAGGKLEETSPLRGSERQDRRPSEPTRGAPRTQTQTEYVFVEQMCLKQ